MYPDHDEKVIVSNMYSTKPIPSKIRNERENFCR